jgi:hypothetical protein
VGLSGLTFPQLARGVVEGSEPHPIDKTGADGGIPNAQARG